MLMHITSLALAALAIPHPKVYADRSAVVIEDSVLTVDALKRMTDFGVLFMKEPDSIKNSAWESTTKRVALTTDLASAGMSQKEDVIQDIVALATKYPSIAADLKQAGLTAPQWEAYRNAILGASYTAQAAKRKGVTPALTSAVGKNVAFLKTHQTTLNKLDRAHLWTGMWLWIEGPAQPDQ